jgi:hypothetical protein
VHKTAEGTWLLFHGQLDHLSSASRAQLRLRIQKTVFTTRLPPVAFAPKLIYKHSCTCHVGNIKQTLSVVQRRRRHGACHVLDYDSCQSKSEHRSHLELQHVYCDLDAVLFTAKKTNVASLTDQDERCKRKGGPD